MSWNDPQKSNPLWCPLRESLGSWPTADSSQDFGRSAACRRKRHLPQKRQSSRCCRCQKSHPHWNWKMCLGRTTFLACRIRCVGQPCLPCQAPDMADFDWSKMMGPTSPAFQKALEEGLAKCSCLVVSPPPVSFAFMLNHPVVPKAVLLLEDCCKSQRAAGEMKRDEQKREGLRLRSMEACLNLSWHLPATRRQGATESQPLQAVPTM